MTIRINCQTIHTLRKATRILTDNNHLNFASPINDRAEIQHLLFPEHNQKTRPYGGLSHSDFYDKEGSDISAKLLRDGFDLLSLNRPANLSDNAGWKRIPDGRQSLKPVKITDIALYLNNWAYHLEERYRIYCQAKESVFPAKEFYVLL